jgi:hypothetical protein
LYRGSSNTHASWTQHYFCGVEALHMPADCTYKIKTDLEFVKEPREITTALPSRRLTARVLVHPFVDGVRVPWSAPPSCRRVVSDLRIELQLESNPFICCPLSLGATQRGNGQIPSPAGHDVTRHRLAIIGALDPRSLTSAILPISWYNAALPAKVRAYVRRNSRRLIVEHR